MEGRLLLKNCAIFRSDGRIRTGMALLVENDRVTRLVPDAELPVLPGDWEVACQGRLVTPGLVDCHTHLVGGQLVPLSGEYLLRNARARLDAEHRLDKALTEDELSVLTEYALARAAISGVTMVVEHLHAPNLVERGLAAQARAAERIGIRLSNSHSSHSLDGPQSAQRMLEENVAYLESHQKRALVRPALGFHASASCDDELLRALGRIREERGSPLHFHLAESEDDLTSTFGRFGRRVVPRLESFGLLSAASVGAYARAVDRSESERLMRSRTFIALGPRVSLSGEPGGGGFESVFAHQNLIGLGTTGRGTLWEELLAAFIGLMQIARVGRMLDPDGALAQLLMGAPAELCSMLYGAPCGTVEPGALADLVVYDHVPPRETEAGVPTNVLGVVGSVRPAWTIVGGRVVVREGVLLGPDYLELSAAAAKVLEALWSRAGHG